MATRHKYPSFFDSHPNVPRAPGAEATDRSLTGAFAVRLRSLQRNADEQRRRITAAQSELAEARQWLRELEREINRMDTPATSGT
jgi:hypothetical protein